MTLKTRSIAAVFGLSLMAVSAASGALTLQINPAAKTFTFLGSDTSSGACDSTSWSFTCTADGNTFADQVLTGPALAAGELEKNFSYISSMMSGSSDAVVGMELLWVELKPRTINGTGLDSSYASFSPAAMTQFESLAGNSLTGSSVFNDIAVVAIPEPTSSALLGLGAVALTLRRRVLRR